MKSCPIERDHFKSIASHVCYNCNLRQNFIFNIFSNYFNQNIMTDKDKIEAISKNRDFSKKKHIYSKSFITIIILGVITDPSSISVAVD